jgi:hypothetical protein
MNFFQFAIVFFCAVTGSICAVLSIRLRSAVKMYEDVGRAVRLAYRTRNIRLPNQNLPTIETTATDIHSPDESVGQ